MEKIAVGILGATGKVGQQYLHLLANHPWFEVKFLAASEKSSGKKVGEHIVHRVEDIEKAKKSCRLIFSAISDEAAKEIEELYAQQGLGVISNGSAHRFTPDVPMIIPEVNGNHAKIIPLQQKNRGWKNGFIVTKPNCSLQGAILPLYPLHQKFGLKRLFVTTFQAVSGAGYPGVPSLDILDNVIPYIAKEEEKTEKESLKILGSVEGSKIKHATGIVIAAHCNRVAVLDGHMACLSADFAKRPTREEILHLWESFPGLCLPSAPEHPIVYRPEENRPQPRLDRSAGNGMTVSVGRLRECPLLSYRFVTLSHNTIRGAAGGGLLTAELLLKQGYLS